MFCPVRKLSLCWVNTFTWAKPADNPSHPCIATATQITENLDMLKRPLQSLLTEYTAVRSREPRELRRQSGCKSDL
jgi:hypothetical protein